MNTVSALARRGNYLVTPPLFNFAGLGQNPNWLAWENAFALAAVFIHQLVIHFQHSALGLTFLPING